MTEPRISPRRRNHRDGGRHLLVAAAAVFAAMAMVVVSCSSTQSETSNTTEKPPAVNVAMGSEWKYLDNGVDQGTAWRTGLFDDSTWKSGKGQFGYGDGDETTLVDFGPDSLAKYRTTYFRKIVNAGPKPTAVLLSMIVDDGAVVYVNGEVAVRDNMPAGSITFDTYSLTFRPDPAERAVRTFELPASLFVPGDNLVAVEVHQESKSSSDLSFDASLESVDRPVPPVHVAMGSLWRYLDDGSDQGIAWRAGGFDASSWKVGNGQFGYGDGDEETVVGYGPDPNLKFFTTYFRRTFVSPDPPTDLTLRLLADDGAVVYVNGQEVVRDNMPPGDVTFQSYTSTARFDAAESEVRSFTIPAAKQRAGINTIAVEVHQESRSSGDLSFDASLEGTATATTTSSIRSTISTSTTSTTTP